MIIWMPDKYLDLLPTWCNGLFINNESKAEKIYAENKEKYPESIIHTATGHWDELRKKYPRLQPHFDEPYSFVIDENNPYVKDRMDWWNQTAYLWQYENTCLNVGETLRNIWKVKKASSVSLTSYSNFLISSMWKLKLVDLFFNEKNKYVFIHLCKDERIWDDILVWCKKKKKKIILYVPEEINSNYLINQLKKFSDLILK